MTNETNKSKIEKKIEPGVFIAITLDDISSILSDLLKETKELRDVCIDIKDMDSKILKEAVDERDEGEYIRRDGTATTTFIVLDIMGILGHYVKGYIIRNDGVNDIYIAHNIIGESLDTDLSITQTRFSRILSGENFTMTYNRKKIRNVYLRTNVGNSNYRLWLTW